MRSSFAIAIATTTLLIGSAFAQEQTTPQAAQAAQAPAASSPGNPAVKTGEGNTPDATAAVAGANSLSEGEAKSRIESQGFTNLTALKKDDQGIWRGKAQRQGKPVDVALDFQGHVYSN
jgi:hypothetical protein